MPYTIAELMEANLLGVFGERDDSKREAKAAEIYSEKSLSPTPRAWPRDARR